MFMLSFFLSTVSRRPTRLPLRHLGLTKGIIYAIICVYMKHNIAVLGDGGWGSTIAILLANKGYSVTLWGAFPEYIETLKKKHLNEKFLPGINIPSAVRFTADISDIPEDAIVALAIPSKYLRKTLTPLKAKIKNKNIISLIKGIELETLKRPSEIIKELLPSSEIAVLSGPTISFEVARNLPATLVAASENEAFTRKVQDVFNTENFRVYTSRDLTGVELGGALKNIIAIAAGISDGMGFGVNTKAALLTRGLVEITRLGVKMGGERETFFGLSGLGDLATTCISTHSRNRWFGEEIGKGKKLENILKGRGMAVEGVTTTKAAYELSKKFGVEMPITEKIYEVLYNNMPPKHAVKELMARALKPEGM